MIEQRCINDIGGAELGGTDVASANLSNILEHENER